MVTEITQGIKVCVEAFYQDEYSNPLNNEFMFAYRVTIENASEHTIKLVSRHWYIFDSVGDYREVEGEGVVGQQPVLAPGTSYQYVSGCNLRSEIGRMYGTYEMQRMDNGKLFNVAIPEFHLYAPAKMN
ncbi:MAG: Co2+/Mg2+ efflux protein ApaG [Chitinophagales bacterium]|nr:Co2+/Mg2+ efflux protein ApaG [Chitinophagales bacterium]